MYWIIYIYILSHLDESAITAVPDYALNSTVWILMKPGAQLLEVHRWWVSDWDTPMCNQAVDRLFFAAQPCLYNINEPWFTSVFLLNQSPNEVN